MLTSGGEGALDGAPEVLRGAAHLAVDGHDVRQADLAGGACYTGACAK